MPMTNVDARSVHSTSSVDLFPNGDMSDSQLWEIKTHLAFTEETKPEDAEYVTGIVADNRLTLQMPLPEHIEQQMVWSSSTSTNSNATIGSPDGAYTWSSGPDITMGGFQVDAWDGNQIKSVELVVHFEVPDALQQDKVRISIINSGFHDLIKTWSNTQNGLYYFNNGWSIEIFDDQNWTWGELENLEINLDYVSEGTTDDSQLRVDAVGLKITMTTPWYGAERVTAKSSHIVSEWPILDWDLNEGTFESVSHAPCGLESSGGLWTAEIMDKPAQQQFGRIHYDQESANGTISLEYLDNQGAWVNIDEGLIPIVSGDLQIRAHINESCLTRIWIDINDPSINIQGDIVGDSSGMIDSSTRWTVVANGITVANNAGWEIGPFDYDIPIGHVMSPSETTLEIIIKAWFNWGNNGEASTLSIVIDEIEVTGGYLIEYDEDPECGIIGSHDLTEDGGGLILPLLTSCYDDRTSNSDLSVSFVNDNPNLIEVDLTEGQIRVKLVPEANGVAQLTTIVSDTSGNYWSEISTFTVANVDDLPVLAEFQSIIPVELGKQHEIDFELSDVDSFASELTVTTNRSWATVDMSERQIIVDSPTPGFTSILVTACDSTSCVTRIIDLEVRSLAELYIEEIRIPENVHAGDIIQIKTMVRNSGEVTASQFGIRCRADGNTIGSGNIQYLMSGDLGSIVFDWQVPENDDSVIIEIELDRGNEIDEIDENNNVDSVVITISPSEEIIEEKSSEMIGTTSIYIVASGILLLIIALFGLFAPSKIKKIE
jgi:hypothetical protein